VRPGDDGNHNQPKASMGRFVLAKMAYIFFLRRGIARPLTVFMKAKSATDKYEIYEANTDESGRVTGFRAKPTPDWWDLLKHEAAEYGKVAFDLAVFILLFILACIFFGR